MYLVRRTREWLTAVTTKFRAVPEWHAAAGAKSFAHIRLLWVCSISFFQSAAVEKEKPPRIIGTASLRNFVSLVCALNFRNGFGKFGFL